jgi:tetratricopeptide (TPR) repeat protein
MLRGGLRALLTGLLLLVGLAFRPLAAAACRPDTAFVSSINLAVEACIRQDWNSALRRMNTLVTQANWHPAPWFYRATVFSYRMTDEESFRWEGAFLADLDSAQIRIDRLRRSRSTRVPECSLRFLEGSIQAWRAYHAGRRESWPTALQAGLSASRTWEALLKECPGWADLELGIGNLRFWTSVKLRRLNWLPFIEDRRAEGLAMVQRARRLGRFSPWLPAANLCWIYLELERPDSTLAICRQALERFPGSRLFLFPKAEALEAQQRWREADLVYQEILASLATDSWPQHVNRVGCLEKRSALRGKLGDAAGARRLAREALALPLEPAERARLKDKLERLRHQAKG